jgi:hypothetical protein
MCGLSVDPAMARQKKAKARPTIQPATMPAIGGMERSVGCCPRAVLSVVLSVGAILVIG